MDIIARSVPFFFVLIGLELLVARVRKRPLYRLSDSISDLSCGILSQLAGIFIALLTIAAYGWVQQHWALQRWLPLPAWSHSAPAWVAVFLLDDLAYYWMHRASHVVNLLWAGHVVHHSSEEFNLTVALRQSSLHGLMSWLFYMPIALLGVPVTMWLVCHALNLVYQFWIHTREVNRLGPLEWILNTPSHHRVHHGINPEYQDKNFAGTLIIWDRLFGSFEPERAAAVYGITKPIQTWNPLYANVHHFAEIARNARAARRWGDRLRAVFAHPRWRPAELGAPLEPRRVSVESFEKYAPPVARELKLYALLQFLVVLAGSLALLGAVGTLATGELLAGGFYVALSLGNIGGMLEARSWAGVSEAMRLLALGGAGGGLLVAGSGPAWLSAASVVFALGSLAWLLRLRPQLRDSDPRAMVAM
jgi:sterol desaturase/sphingolipid hydroxylase (fatty acid hydroxylase superfamily)